MEMDLMISRFFINNSDAGGFFSGKSIGFCPSLQGNATIDLGNADYSFVAENLGDHLGYSVASAGDDGDGLSDILIGAQRAMIAV